MKKSILFPFLIDIQLCLSGEVHELPSSTNWMKLWKYITLELKQSSIWFIPYTNGKIVAKLMQKRWLKVDIERIIKGDYVFYDLNDFDMDSIMKTIYFDLEKHKKDWLIIKCDSYFVEKNREQLQRIANVLNTRVILICK
jgi:hypothetical protein